MRRAICGVMSGRNATTWPELGSVAKKQPVVVSQPTRFEISAGGFADNISFFVNVTFPVAGEYLVQTLIDSNLYDERVLTVSDQQLIAPQDEESETIN